MVCVGRRERALRARQAPASGCALSRSPEATQDSAGRHEGWIVENEQGEPIGEAYYKTEREYYGYRAEKMAGIDLKLAKRFWGQGYASDALRTLIRYLFEKGFETIVVSPNLSNKAALKLCFVE